MGVIKSEGLCSEKDPTERVTDKPQPVENIRKSHTQQREGSLWGGIYKELLKLNSK